MPVEASNRARLSLAMTELVRVIESFWLVEVVRRLLSGEARSRLEHKDVSEQSRGPAASRGPSRSTPSA